MATHYKGERIDELLGEIATLQDRLDRTRDLIVDPQGYEQYSRAYTAILLAKAKLTALQGDDYAK